MADKLYIIDGHSQIYRAYYAPFRDLTSPTGEPTRATYVFCSMLLKLIRERRPHYLAMAVDGPAEKLHRRSAYADYKVTRKPSPEDLPVQIRRILQIVRAMGIPILECEGYEADDVIASLAQRYAGADMDVVVVSSDKDLDQIVNDHVVLFDPMKDKQFDAAAIEAIKGYPPSLACEVQALMGDSIDNIPGVPGVGPKRAAELVRKYGSVEAVIEHASELTPKLAEAVTTHADSVRASRKLVELVRDVPLTVTPEDMVFRGINGSAISPIFRELEFGRLLDQLEKLGATGDSPLLDQGVTVAPQAQVPAEPVVQRPAGETTAADFDYRCISSPAELEQLAKQLAGVTRLAIDTETTGPRPMWAELVGMSLAWQPGTAYYLSVKGPMGQAPLSVDDIHRCLGPILADENVVKIGQNLKYDLIILQNAGLDVRGPMFDTLLAAYTLDSTRMTYRLDALAMDFLNHRMIPIEDLIGRGKNQTTMDTVPIETVAVYAAEDADIALKLAGVLERQLRDEGLTELFERLEMPLMPVLAEMERAGIMLDPQVLRKMETALGNQAEAVRMRVITAAGREFNPDSPKQLGDILFSHLNLPIIRKGKNGPSTDSIVLDELAVLHELPGLILEYRRLTKLISTYLSALGQCIHPRTGRIHTCFNQAGTSTGRLSSSDPNLQNVPIRTEEGRRIRSAFVAAPGCMLLSADYSQVELRVLAHLCRDETLMRAFHEDKDIHRIVAAEVFGVPEDQVASDQRAKAKTVNFGIIYGQTAYGLSVTLRIPKNEAAEFIHRYRQRFPRIDAFLQDCIRAAKTQGYVETILHRRRRITDIDSRNPQKRALAERLAINSVVQGSAADLIKQAMVNISRRIKAENRPSRMLLQIHDELLFEVPAEAVDAEREMIAHEMTAAVELSVPLKVDTGAGANWMDAK